MCVLWMRELNLTGKLEVMDRVNTINSNSNAKNKMLDPYKHNLMSLAKTAVNTSCNFLRGVQRKISTWPVRMEIKSLSAPVKGNYPRTLFNPVWIGP